MADGFRRIPPQRDAANRFLSLFTHQKFRRARLPSTSCRVVISEPHTKEVCHMRVVSRLLAAFLIAALVVPAVATPAAAAQNASTLNVVPTTGPVGTEVDAWGRTGTNNSSRGWIYFEVDPGRNTWVRVLTNSIGNWSFFPVYKVVDDVQVIDYYNYESESFEVPDSIGGISRIAIVTSDLGSTATTSQVTTHKAPAPFRNFTVIPQIIIESEDEGPAGTEVEVSGTGFGYREDITIYFDGDEVELLDDIRANDFGSWTGSFLVPLASQGMHDITASGNDTDEADVIPAEFEVTPGISIEPNEGTVGSVFTVLGNGFAANETGIEILFNTVAVTTGLSANVDGVFTADVTVPTAAMGEHSVGARGNTTSAASVQTVTFEVQPELIVTPLSGYVGTEVEVTATGLPATTTVTVTYSGITMGTGTTTANGTLAPILFEATHPQAVHTPQQPITITFNAATLEEIFEMDSTPPPTPTPVEPPTGTRIGFVGRQTPTLEWTQVEDPSGVSYNLQISATADFTQILISKAGLETTSYTLTEEEALPYGTYYWRVKAIDGAMNESDWSESSNFTSGLLPLWALITIGVLALILIAALIYVLIIRDRVGLYD